MLGPFLLLLPPVQCRPLPWPPLIWFNGAAISVVLVVLAIALPAGWGRRHSLAFAMFVSFYLFPRAAVFFHDFIVGLYCYPSVVQWCVPPTVYVVGLVIAVWVGKFCG
jgi:hypothetical protein